MSLRFLTEQVVGVGFRFYSDEEIKKQSVKRITNPVTFDTYNLPTEGGLYDRALGPTEFKDVCPTCGLTFQECPGHLGHIELSVPVYNPTLFPLMYRLLRLKCYSCHRFRISSMKSEVLKVKLMLLDCGRLNEAMELDTRLAARPGLLDSRNGKKSENKSEDISEGDYQSKLLNDLALDCIASYGPNVGCGLYCNRDAANSQHVRLYRSEIINEFLRSFPTKSCANCGALSLAIRKDGFSKIFQKPLSQKMLADMRSMGIYYRSATGILALRERQQSDALSGSKSADEEDVEMGFEVDDVPSKQSKDSKMQSKASKTSSILSDDEDDSDSDAFEVATGGSESNTKPRFMPASEVAAQMQLLWERECELLRRVFMPVEGEGNMLRSNRTGKSGRLAPAPTSSGSTAGWKNLFLRTLAVPPPRFRAPMRMGDQQYEHPQNVAFSKIIRLSDALIDLGLGTRTGREQNMKGGVDMAQTLRTWMELQNTVNGLIDSTKMQTQNGKEPPAGIRQLLEKKEGIFRKNMMGKRVNFAARTVISPDPSLRVDQVGVPLRFAKKLYFKQPVTSWNVSHLRKLVINGHDIWPGATHVEEENGTVIDLSTTTRAQREAIAKRLLTPSTDIHSADPLSGRPAATHPLDVDFGAAAAAAAAAELPGVGIKRVWRHLQDGDIVLMNRQPTLHKPSLMAHRARVMKAWPLQQILRFHYANCKTYNADFDGDEMNMHLPQDELGRAEAYFIANNDNQYLSATGGAPLRGLIQDHNAISAILTKRDAFLTKDEYCQLVFAGVQAFPHYGLASSGAHEVVNGFPTDVPMLDVPMEPPAILKPQRLWTGKQVMTSILKALTAHLPVAARSLYLDANAKIGDGNWGEGNGRKDIIPIGDSRIIIRNNELLVGVIDKNSLGNSSFGLIHAVYEIYGAQYAGLLLSAYGRLLTVYLNHAAMTCGMDDLILCPEAESQRKALLKEGIEKGAYASAAFAGMKPPSGPVAKNPQWVRNVRRRIRDKLRGGAAGADVTGEAAVAAAVALDNAVKSAASQTHSAVIKACLPFGLAKTFPSNQFSLMVTSGAKGSMINHAMIAVGLGQQELEGRRVPIMPSGKSLPSFPAFDPSPRAGGYIADRFLTGLRPQDYFFHCMSGREGLVDTAVKTSRSGYLQRCLIKHLEALRVHYDYSVRDSDGGLVQFAYGEDGVDVLSSPYQTGEDSQLGFLARNHGPLSHTYSMSAPVFARALQTLDAVSADREARFNGAANLLAAALASPSPVAVAAASGARAASTISSSWSAAFAAEDGRPPQESVQILLPVAEIEKELRAAFAASGRAQPRLGQSQQPLEIQLESKSLYGKATSVSSLLGARTAVVDATVLKFRSAGNFVPDLAEKSEDDEAYHAPTVDVEVSYALSFQAAGFAHSSFAAADSDNDSDSDESDSNGKKKAAKVKGLDRSKGDVRVAVPFTVRIKKVPMLLASGSPVTLSGLTAADASLLVVLAPRPHDPALSNLLPGSNLGCFSEKLQLQLHSYLSRNPHALVRPDARLGVPAGPKVAPGHLPHLSANGFNLLLWVKALRAFAHPGEAVGVVAGQSIGEPSTQMTLNTFHLAGGGGVNVTLGIPRLREIVMTASPNPKTPQMGLPIAQFIDNASELASREVAGRVARTLSPLAVSELLAVERKDGGIRVVERLVPKGREWVREYAVRLYFSDIEAIEAAFSLKFDALASSIASSFAPKLIKIISDDLRKAQRAAGTGQGDLGFAKAKRGHSEYTSAQLSKGNEDDDDDQLANEDPKRSRDDDDDNEDASKGKDRTPRARGDDSESEDEEVEGAEEGTSGERVKEMQGYDDVDADAVSDSDSDMDSNSNPKNDSSSSDDSSSDSSPDTDAPFSSSKAKKSSDKKKPEASSNDILAKSLSKGTFVVAVPSALALNPRFGGMLASDGSATSVTTSTGKEHLAAEDLNVPWVELRIMFPASTRKVLMLSSAERAARMAMVHSIPRVTRAVVARQKLPGSREDRTVVLTEGVNMEAIWALSVDLNAKAMADIEAVQELSAAAKVAPNAPIIDINRLQTNDIYAVLKSYGVEAARACIVKETKAVFGAYGIDVNPRHLYLIADYMTQNGGFRPMNRAGIEAHGSPFLKMSFETTAKFLTDALLSSEFEHMVSPSARVVMGRVMDAGTGSFDLWQPMA